MGNWTRLFIIAASVSVASCGESARPDPNADALATILTPRQAPDYYVEQANKYFDTLDTGADPDNLPNYSDLVARWELPPWLLLTGFGRQNMIDSTRAALALEPSTVPVRHCRAFDVQPFARCYITFEYAEGSCPIYEEFVFNDDGEITFIEAWSAQPGYLPMADPLDAWAEGPGVTRLSTRLPGLGSAEGRIDVASESMQMAVTSDPEIADFVARTQDFVSSWLQAARDAGPDYFSEGCGWLP